MDGVLNVLKPPGMTSHDVVYSIRKITGQRKAGHTGTLDPGAAGVLIVCLGKATKVIQFMDDDKEYRAEIVFGKSTTSQDSFGDVIKTKNCSSLTIENIHNNLHHFTGEIEQLPPMTSALKYKGKKLYELARRGTTVERKKRKVNVHKIDIVYNRNLGTTEPSLIIDIGCSAGTYVRTFCSDFGEWLGYCAYMSFLLRTRVGLFSIEDSYTLESLEELSKTGRLKDALFSISEALANLPEVVVSENDSRAISNGNAINLTLKDEHLQFPDRLVRIEGPKGIIAIGQVYLKAYNILHVKPVKVLV